MMTRGINILLIPILTYHLTTSEYGILDYLALTSTILITICGLEIHQALARFSSDKKYRYNELATTGILFLCGTYGLIYLVAIGFSCTIKNKLLQLPNNISLIIVMASFFLQALIYYISVILRFQLKTVTNVILNGINAATTLILTVCSVVFLKLGLSGVVYSTFLSNLICSIFGIYYIQEYIKKPKFNYEYLKHMMQFSSPLIISSLSVYIMLYADRIVIKHMLGMQDLGIFSVAYRLASIIGLVMAGMSSAITPIIYKQLEDPNLSKHIGKLLNKTIIIGLLIVIAIKIIAYPVLKHVIGTNYKESIHLFPNIAIAILFSQLYIFSPGLQIAKKTTIIMYLNICAAILNLAFATILTKFYGITGVAFSSCIAYISYYFLYTAFAQKFFYINSKHFLHFLLTILVLAIIFML
jgi:O-antigen/teichoic acid export membrane protein